jgi:hypothetical protein
MTKGKCHLDPRLAYKDLSLKVQKYSSTRCITIKVIDNIAFYIYQFKSLHIFESKRNIDMHGMKHSYLKIESQRITIRRKL